MEPSGKSSVKTTTTPASDAKLAVGHVACAKRAELDHRGAQVLMDGEGEPWRMKTGNEVPASVHGPCFIEIGGDEPAGSSYAGLPAGERSSRKVH
jgi:hypothetical protein